MRGNTHRPHILTTIGAVHRAILFVASLALDHPVDISLNHLGRFYERADEGIAGVFSNSAESRRGKGCPALMAAEIRRGGSLLAFKTCKAERVEAGKGAWVGKQLVAHRTFHQLFNFGLSKHYVTEECHQKEERKVRTWKGVLPGSEGTDKGISFLLGWTESFTNETIIHKEREEIMRSITRKAKLHPQLRPNLGGILLIGVDQVGAEGAIGFAR